MCIMKYYLDVEMNVKEYFVNYVERYFYLKVKKIFFNCDIFCRSYL